MKAFRYLALIVALAIPATALAAHAMASDCCDDHTCCPDGCPLCAHHAK